MAFRYFLPKIYILIAFGIIARCDMNSEESEESLNKIWSIPQKDGRFRLISQRQALFEMKRAETEVLESTNSDRVRFFLYTQSNPTEPLEIDMDDEETLVRSKFNFTNPTRFMIHGWGDGYDREMSTLLREALLQNGEKRKLNYIAVDWSVYSSNKNYVIAKKGCSKAGKTVAEFIDWLHLNGKLSFDTLTVYGHSLGAHVAGFTGKNVKRGRISSIVGLDPAMPLFQYNNPKTRLADTDAEYVESIHTNGGWIGFFKPIGQIAFYPNGGRVQPGCEDDISGLCSHLRAVELLAETLRMNEENHLLGVRCSELNHIVDASCNEYCNVVRLGDPSNANRPKGVYYLETNSESPFALGLGGKRVKAKRP